MKKVIYTIVIVGAILGLFWYASAGNKITEKTEVAAFAFDANLQLAVDEEVEVKIEVKDGEDIAKMDVFYDDTLLHTWKAPKENISFKLNGKIRGVGAKRLDLISTLKDGTTQTDNRMVRVVSDITPSNLVAEIVNTYPHNTGSFTQGLEFYNGKLFESTGLNGKSKVFEVNPTTGIENEEMSMALDATHFGEGITIMNDIIYQITWQNQKCITYDLSDKIVPKGEFSYKGEGWGMCNDGTSLIMSNGTERLVFRNPETFMVERTIEVYNNFGPIIALNELEFIDGLIYANVWMTEKIMVIDPATGKVLQEIDGADLRAKGQGPDQEVMNGIAYDATTGKTYVTGKNWAALFEVNFIKKEL